MKYSIFVRNFVVLCRIGITPAEQGITQPVRFTVEVNLNTTSPIVSLRQSLDYDAIVQFIQKMAENHIDLAETMAEKIAGFVLQQENVQTVTVDVEKLAILEAGGSVGVRLHAAR